MFGKSFETSEVDIPSRREVKLAFIDFVKILKLTTDLLTKVAEEKKKQNFRFLYNKLFNVV